MKKLLAVLALLAAVLAFVGAQDISYDDPFAAEVPDEAPASDVADAAPVDAAGDGAPLTDAAADPFASGETPAVEASPLPVDSSFPEASPAPLATEAPAEGIAPRASTLPASTVDVGTTQTARYTVLSELGQADADLSAKTLEAWFELYNSYFHFDTASLKARLQVRIFADKGGFDAYLQAVIGDTRDDFVYLHYPTPQKSELLVWAKDDAEDYQLSLAHQAFVQYLKAFAPAVPLWLREGFAVYFETSRYDQAGGKALYVENLSWLETVKAYRSEGSLMPLDTFLSLSADQAREQLDIFYPQSWAFVSFLLQSEDKAANRLLWDAISRLETAADAEATSAQIFALASRWPGVEALAESFDDYLDAKKTFPEMVAQGISEYNEKKYDDAYKTLTAALAMDSTSHVPWYYRGLVNYYRKDYAMAEVDYRKALDLGCEAGIGNYALGVNAFVMGQGESAKGYLALAKEASPELYGPKADEVLARIK